MDKDTDAFVISITCVFFLISGAFILLGESQKPFQSKQFIGDDTPLDESYMRSTKYLAKCTKP